MRKPALRDAIVAQLQNELELQSRAAHESRDEATSVENKAEGQYDMRSQEAAYLAEGQARLASEIADGIAAFQGIDFSPLPPGSSAAVGALVTLEAKGKQSRYFIGPRHGGLEVKVDASPVIVVTPSSPLGRQLIGKRAGDSVQLPGRGAPIVHRITAIE